MVGRHKVLIVEDDVLLQKMYKAKCMVEGYEVDTADDGQDGLEKARNGSPDIMLLDILMPKLNGLQVLRKMRHDPELQRIPVVMLTNLANLDSMRRAINMGAVGYLVKSDNTPGAILEFVKDKITNVIRAEIAAGTHAC